MPLGAGTVIGPYEIQSAIGAGGMGEVYRATDTNLGRDVAIKVLPDAFVTDPARLARFEREAKTLAALNHPNIAQIYGLERSGTTPALVMELVEGETLADRISRGRIPLDEALPIARQIAEALEAAHEQGIIHRDLKPANVKVRPDGTVKVLDFGLAKLNEPHAGTPNVTPALSMSPTITSPALMTGIGVLLGTAAYMSPEQAKGRPADKRSDAWAFGCVLYEMLTGQRPFDGADIAEVLGAVVRLEPDWTLLARLPGPLVTLIRRCLAKDPNVRVADASTIRYVIDDVTLPTHDATVPVVARTRLRWTIAAVCLAAFAASTFVALRHVMEQAPEVMPVQFDVTSAESSTFVGAVPTSAISPDGRLLAFIATSNGKPMLWVRSLANASAQPLAGTEGATDPFWSPDSQWLAFVTPPQLKKVAATGGAIISLTDVANGIGGTWSKDNIIVMSSGSELWSIAASGGAKTSLSSVDKARGETGYRYPSFLPDGRHYLFLVTRGSQREVRVASLDDRDVKTVLTDASRTLYASGHLLFSRAGVLMAVPFDANTLRLTGEPFPMADHVAESTSAGYAPFSVSENRIVSFAHAGGDTIQLTWKDRNGTTLGTVGDAGDYRDLSSFGPDGRVVLSRTTNSNRDVWVIDPARATSARVTFGSATEANPALSPDGNRVAFSGGAAGDGLYEKSSDGSGDERVLAKLDGNGGVNDWSSDGRFIAYRVGVAQTQADVWIVPTDGKAKPFPMLKTQYDEDNATFSPDVRWIAYESNESGEKQIYVQPFPPTGPKYQISRNGGSRPRWRADGREIFFIGPDGSMMTARVNSDRPYQAETPMRLFDSGIATESGKARMYAVTPDGSRFLLAIPRQRSTPTPITVIVNWLEATKPRNTTR